MTAEDTIAQLEARLREAKDFLAHTQIEATRYFLDQALGRYMWGAIATTEAILAAARAGKATGAKALERQLHESLIDVYFMLSAPDPDLCAAQSVLTDLADWRDLWRLHAQVVAQHPDFPFPPIPEEWRAVLSRRPEEATAQLDRISAEYGGPPDLFTRASQVLDKSRHWHWSGLSRTEMIRELRRRGQIDEGGAAIAKTITKLYNVGSHASPSWSLLTVDIRGEANEHIFPDPGAAAPDEVNQLARGAAHFLAAIHAAVATRVRRRPAAGQ